MLSPKQVSGDNILQTVKKTYTSSVISCCRLCGSVKDVSHCKSLFKKTNKELLALAAHLEGKQQLLRDELLLHVHS